MIVPRFSPEVPNKSGGGGNVVPLQRPTETQLLMALAEMHRQGRFQTAAVDKLPYSSTNIEDRRTDADLSYEAEELSAPYNRKAKRDRPILPPPDPTDAPKKVIR